MDGKTPTRGDRKLSEESVKVYVFHTDVGYVKTSVEDIDFSDVEDVIKNKSFSQAQSMKFENIKNTRSINARQGPRTMKTSYSNEGGL